MRGKYFFFGDTSACGGSVLFLGEDIRRTLYAAVSRQGEHKKNGYPNGGIPVFVIFRYVVIPLTHHKNSGYTELKVLVVYLVGVLKG
ncbi:conserved domain protein [Ruminococcus albus 8]|uniref:Conserved domain protein n=1 Tax=Ruminococcus albus 8 TaxID=246199 RepID=E9SDL2_RUMAL|nr:conserved domain protein [Ruminococcus albus 8]